MFNKFLWVTMFWIFMIYCLIMLIPYTFLFIPPFKQIHRQHLVYFMQWLWSRFCLRVVGAKVNFTGFENVPKDNIYCVVSNHQGGLDIPILMSIFPWTLGFIAKKELLLFPILNVWMIAVGCIFLNRKSARNAVEVFDRAKKQLQSAHPMAIFPEGTRSKTGEIAAFKPGSLKLAIRAEVPIIPVTIDGSGILEGRNSSKEIFVTIHEKIEYAEIADLESSQVAEKIRDVIVSSMRNK